MIQDYTSLQLAQVQPCNTIKTLTKLPTKASRHTSLTIDIPKEGRLIEELWDEFFLVCSTVIDVGPRTRNGEELTVGKVKPKGRYIKRGSV